ncbi:MAG: tryptophan--tRNA ligase, partial [Actinomycetota bacterium]|nr:tryptophan--tRNA ligase [Actinomycetota bacterium]
AYVGSGYGDLKQQVAEVVADAMAPFRTRTLELLDDRGELDKVLSRGADRARQVSAATLETVYDRIGFVPAV